MDTLPI
ncbi:hypothetical protein M8C21_014399 [Ambrosia artemisiifolia]|nr:hypothetical protein M8C21_014399 [Ambrosia artemisiifolia]